MACHTPPFKKAKKQGKLPLPPTRTLLPSVGPFQKEGEGVYDSLAGGYSVRF